MEDVRSPAAVGGGARRGVALAGALLVLLAVAYLGVAVWAGTRSAAGATVAGLDVGGLDRTSIRQRLDAELAPRADREIAVVAGSGRATLVPSRSGLGVDTTATAEELTGFTLKPARLVERLRGGAAVEPLITRDDARLRTAVDGVAGQLDQAAVEGSITFTSKGATLVKSVEGRQVDRSGAADAIARSWLGGGPVTVPAKIDKTTVSATALQQGFDGFARPATSGPLRLTIGDRTVVVPVAQLAPTLSLKVSTPGVLTPSVDGVKLAKVVVALDPQVERSARNASIDVVGTKPVITAGQVGQKVDPKALAAAVLPALTSAERVASVEPVVMQPELTTEGVKRLGIVERVSTFTTQFPVNPPRTQNIRIAAGTLDGMVVKPGETFSLNAALGQRTPAKGYQRAPVISGGRLTMDYGGGISQVSTTLFNAVFFSGLDTVVHTPHSFYISRYPEGREATVSWPTVDQKFRNDSGNGILIKTAVSSSAITVSFYGTKVWDIQATKGPRTNVRQPKTIRDTSADCVPQSANIGFDVAVTRIFKRDGRQIKSERFFTRYIPEDRVICE